MTRHGIVRATREVFLTFGALLGVVCLVATVAGVAFGVKPLVFRSGSMSPAIATGDLAVARSVDVTSLERGDIVSVVNQSGTRITHRLIDYASQGDARQLTLKGDANTSVDAEVYVTSRAEKVLFHVPKAGYVVDAATSPAGLFVLGLYVAGMLVLVFRRNPPAGGGPDEPSTPVRPHGGARKAPKASRSRASSRVAVVAGVAVTVLVASPAMAAWTDGVAVTGSSFTARKVPAPTNLTCTDGGNASLTWTTVGAGYSYRIEVRRNSDNVLLASDTTTSTSYTVTTAFLGNVVSTNLTATVKAFPTGVPSWVSNGSPTALVRSRTLSLGTACGNL